MSDATLARFIRPTKLW